MARQSDSIRESQNQNKNIIEKFRGLGLLSKFRETSTQKLYKELLETTKPDNSPSIELQTISEEARADVQGPPSQ